MVLTDDNINNLPPAERIKKLKELQIKKQTELKKLREEKEQEIAHARKSLEQSMEELELESEHHRGEHEKKGEEHEVLVDSLEESVVDAPTIVPGSNVSYASPLEKLMPASLYDLSDYNLYNELKRLEDKGYVTPEEQQRINKLQSQASSITDAYSVQDKSQVNASRGNYLSRTEEVLKRLDRKMHDLQDGVYDLNRRDTSAVYK